MKNSFLLALIVTFTNAIGIMAQTPANDPVILSVDKHDISKSEFLRIYNKNNPQNSKDIIPVKDYMELFVNYKLKVVEAEHLGFDTAASFVSEYKNYRDQLAKPYLTDEATEDKLLHEAYERMMNEVHVRQVFLKAGTYASPADTLAAYNKAMEVIGKLKAGEPWDSVALKYSQDNSVEKNKGDYGYFTAFQTLYAFEYAASKMKIGELREKPVRSKIGYHVMQLLDKRTARGEIKVAHIMAAFPENSSPGAVDSVRAKISDIYNRLKAGENFEELAKTYSDDKRSAVKGGELNWFGVGAMIPEFENAAFALTKDGEYSAPIRTSFGWHILKRLSTRTISPFDELKEAIKQKMMRDERALMGQQALVNKIKKEINFKDSPEKLNALYPVLDTTFFSGKWKSDKAPSLAKEILFTLQGKNYSVKDFADYMVATSHMKKPVDFGALVKIMYNDYVTKNIIAFENSRLDTKYPEFRFLVQEYHDGILLFNLMEQKIWNYAAKDTVGLLKFYDEHKENYKWTERIEALVVTSTDKKLVDSAYTFANDFNNGKITADGIWKKICPDTTESCLNCQLTHFEKGDNNILDSLGWEPGITSLVNREGKFGFFVKKGRLAAGPKTLDDAKGTCIADYQEYLEKQYIAELKKKYTIVLNQQVLDSCVKQ